MRLQVLTVVVDDPDLGRQAFRAGSGPFEPGTLSGPPGCRAIPPLPSDLFDAELLHDLCAASLRVEVMRGDGEMADDLGAAELALRRLPGVHAVVVEREADFTVVQVHADEDAAPDLAREAARATRSIVETGLVVEIVREMPTPEPVHYDPTAAEADEEVATTDVVRERPAASTAPVIVAVRSDAEAGEVEVHVRGADVRSIGRAPVAQGLAGACHATLDAMRDIDAGLQLGLGWARTIETTAERRFVVAVGLNDATSRETSHGLGEGDNPIEAAAHATLDAIARRAAES